MKKNLVKKAFSLIELSLVILIIGVIIVGITQGSRVISAMRLALARNLTNNSEVNNISDLVFWLEPTLLESFRKSEADEGKRISEWHDSNSSAQSKKNFTASASSMISYKRYAINNLPSVYFSGVDGSSEENALKSTAIISENNNFTIFIVAQNLSLGAYQTAFFNGNYANNGYGYLLDDASNRSFFLGGLGSNTSGSSTGSLNPEIIIIADNGSTITYEINALAQEVATPLYAAITPSASDPSVIGSKADASWVWNGYISEVIFFGRALKPSEISDVRKYLSKKYNIKLS